MWEARVKRARSWMSFIVSIIVLLNVCVYVCECGFYSCGVIV
jgi:t-SNARE complex subunit (syntaxin)